MPPRGVRVSATGLTHSAPTILVLVPSLPDEAERQPARPVLARHEVLAYLGRQRAAGQFLACTECKGFLAGTQRATVQCL